MKSQPERYYQHKFAPTGSSLYYSTRYLPEAEREAVLTLHAFAKEMAAIVNSAKDSAIANTKLRWWEQELQRVIAGHPTHPLAIALKPLLQHYKLPHDLLLEIIQGQQLKLEVDHCCTLNDLLLYCYREQGLLMIVTAYIPGAPEPSCIQFAHDIGICLGLIEMIVDLRQSARLGRIYFPLEELEQFNVTPAIFAELKMTEELRAFLTFQAKRARDYYQQALNKLPRGQHFNQQHLIILAQLKLALLEEIEKGGFPVFTVQTRLTPLRKLWRSWRGYRGLK